MLSVRRFSSRIIKTRNKTKEALYRASKIDETAPFDIDSIRIIQMYKSRNNRTEVPPRMIPPPLSMKCEKELSIQVYNEQYPMGTGPSLFGCAKVSALMNVAWNKLPEGSNIPENFDIVADNPQQPNHRICTNTTPLSLSAFERGLQEFGEEPWEWMITVRSVASGQVTKYLKSLEMAGKSWRQLMDLESGSIIQDLMILMAKWNRINTDVTMSSTPSLLEITEKYMDEDKWPQLPVFYDEQSSAHALASTAFSAYHLNPAFYDFIIEKNPEIFVPEMKSTRFKEKVLYPSLPFTPKQDYHSAARTSVWAEIFEDVDQSHKSVLIKEKFLEDHKHENVSITVPSECASSLIYAEAPFSRRLPPFTDSRYLQWCFAYRGLETYFHSLKSDILIAERVDIGNRLDDAYYKLWNVYNEHVLQSQMKIGNRYLHEEGVMRADHMIGGMKEELQNSLPEFCGFGDGTLYRKMSAFVLCEFLFTRIVRPTSERTIDESLPWDLKEEDRLFIGMGMETYAGEFLCISNLLHLYRPQMNDRQIRIASFVAAYAQYFHDWIYEYLSDDIQRL